mmetsp:Transcript_77962/g.215553  ORF Transcript_77962/g.215553 Transcript_77962/m.215553 type:complete len:203 (+) Transcript_77962:61-669(+)
MLRKLTRLAQAGLLAVALGCRSCSADGAARSGAAALLESAAVLGFIDSGVSGNITAERVLSIIVECFGAFLVMLGLAVGFFAHQAADAVNVAVQDTLKVTNYIIQAGQAPPGQRHDSECARLIETLLVWVLLGLPMFALCLPLALVYQVFVRCIKVIPLAAVLHVAWLWLAPQSWEFTMFTIGCLSPLFLVLAVAIMWSLHL